MKQKANEFVLFASVSIQNKKATKRTKTLSLRKMLFAITKRRFFLLTMLFKK